MHVGKIALMTLADQSRPLVSIIMPAYNAERFIAQAIASVQAQTLTDWELIVSDDASTDSTLAIVQQIAEQDGRIVMLEPAGNQGPARARNRAIERATGRYIAFLDSDDLWKPSKLETQIGFMRQNQIAFSFSSYDRLSEDGRFLNAHNVAEPVNYSDLLKSCTIGCLTAVYDTEILCKEFMPNVKGAEDFGLWLRILKKIDKAYPLPDSLACYRVRTHSLSSDKWTAASYTWRIYREVEQLGFFRSGYYFLHYAVRGVMNSYFAR